jgi:uncharacterized protein (TIGR03089 family)
MSSLAGSGGNTVRSLFEAALATDPTRPMLTFYDDATGERVELSGATLANWVAKTANLLVDDLGSGPADRAALALPPHWQTAAVLLGCWSAGLAVRYTGPGKSTDDDAAVAFASLAVIRNGDVFAGTPDRYVLGLAPLGAPLRETVPGWLDYIGEVRVHGDHFAGTPIDAASPALLQSDGGYLSHATLTARAVDRAGALGIAPGSRVLVVADPDADPEYWLLPALAVGASTVLCVNVDPQSNRAPIERRAASEQADLIIGLE